MKSLPDANYLINSCKNNWKLAAEKKLVIRNKLQSVLHSLQVIGDCVKDDLEKVDTDLSVLLSLVEGSDERKANLSAEEYRSLFFMWEQSKEELKATTKLLQRKQLEDDIVINAKFPETHGRIRGPCPVFGLGLQRNTVNSMLKEQNNLLCHLVISMMDSNQFMDCNSEAQALDITISKLNHTEQNELASTSTSLPTTNVEKPESILFPGAISSSQFILGQSCFVFEFADSASHVIAQIVVKSKLFCNADVVRCLGNNFYRNKCNFAINDKVRFLLVFC